MISQDDYVDRLILRSYLQETNEAIEIYKKNRLLSESSSSALSGLGGYFANMGSEFLGDAGSGFKNAFSEFLIDQIFSILGLEAKTTVGEFFLEILKEFIENVVITNPTNIAKYFDAEEGCKYISKDLIQVLGEAGGDVMLRLLLKKISDPSYREELLGEEGAGGFEAALITNLINALNDNAVVMGLSKVFKEMFQTQILERLEEYIEKAVCNSNLSLGDQFSSYFGFGGEEKDVVLDDQESEV